MGLGRAQRLIKTHNEGSELPANLRSAGYALGTRDRLGAHPIFE